VTSNITSGLCSHGPSRHVLPHVARGFLIGASEAADGVL
jgi:hypothetical protein